MDEITEEMEINLDDIDTSGYKTEENAVIQVDAELKTQITEFLATIETDGDLKLLAKEALAEIKVRKQTSDSVHIQDALLKYAETNELGKKIYSIPEVAKLTGVSAAKIHKALKALAPLAG